jgi:penicillin-binding protein 1C
LEYLIDKADTQQIMLQAIAANDVDKVYWYVNDRFIMPSAPNEKVFFTATDGKTKISCTDDKGRNTNAVITVKYVRF